MIDIKYTRGGVEVKFFEGKGYIEDSEYFKLKQKYEQLKVENKMLKSKDDAPKKSYPPLKQMIMDELDKIDFDKVENVEIHVLNYDGGEDESEIKPLNIHWI